MTEEQGYSLIKKASMNMRKPMANIAEAIILTSGLLKIKRNYSLPYLSNTGHTSGCISIIETTHGLLFSADSVFAGGTLSYIAESGSVGDYIDSLTRLRYFGPQALYPGQSKISTTPIEDIDQAIGNAQIFLLPRSMGAPEIFYQKSDGC